MGLEATEPEVLFSVHRQASPLMMERQEVSRILALLLM